MKIFILEDDAERMKVFTRMFLGHQMVASNNKEISEQIVESIKFDAIFLDDDLGGQVMVDSADDNTGYQLCKHISNLNTNTLVIIHSWNNIGAKRIKDRLDANHRGQVVYLPFGSKEFHNAVQQILEKG